MTELLEKTSIDVAGSGVVTVVRSTADHSNHIFDRYLKFHDDLAYYMGNDCDTCEFLFRRLPGGVSQLSPQDIGDQLRVGVGSLRQDIIDPVAGVLGPGRYEIGLEETIPRLVSPGSGDDYFSHEQIKLWGTDSFSKRPHDPFTDYYRAASLPLGNGRRLFEFIIPIVPQELLKTETATAYATRLRSGVRSTALALSVLDVKQPANWEGDLQVVEHWCLAHYLLDGHHKIFASAETHCPVTLLFFLAEAEGTASPAQVQVMLEALESNQPLA